MTATSGADGEDVASGVLERGAEPVIRLLRWEGPWAPDDRDANLKADVAIYADADPLVTLDGLARAVGVPVGALARYVLARWAAGGSEGLLELGPSTVGRMVAEVERAERDGSDAARLEAYDVLRQQVGWLATGLDDGAGNEPGDGGGSARSSGADAGGRS